MQFNILLCCVILSMLYEGVNSFATRNILKPKAVSKCWHNSEFRFPTRRSGTSSLRMHFGHGHGQNHHHHHHDSDQKYARNVVSIGSTTEETHGVNQFWWNHRKEKSRVLLAGLVVLGSVVTRGLRRKMMTATVGIGPLLGRADLVMFVTSIAGLSMLDDVRNEFARFQKQVQRLRDGFTKHVRPLKNLFQVEDTADRVTKLGVVTNLLLSAGKLFVGVMCHSNVLVADAGHSLSDLFSDFVTLWAVQIGRLPPDEDHPYGYGKFEAIGSLFLAFTLLATGFGVANMAAHRLMEVLLLRGTATTAAFSIPTLPALLMAGLSIVSKEWLFRITRRVGEHLNSPVIIANAWHHRSDAYSSVMALLSIGIAMTVPGMLAVDSAAGLLVAGMISVTGFEIMGEAVHQLADSNNVDLANQVTELVFCKNNKDIARVDRIRVRQMGSSAIVDASISTTNQLTSSATRALEDRLRCQIIDEVPKVLDADIRATGPKLCPLIRAMIEEQNDISIKARKQDVPEEHLPRRAAEIELEARQLLLQAHTNVQSIEGIMVHYLDKHIIAVDANIRLDPDLTVAEASHLASGLQKNLQSSESIHLARIYLDLNEGPRQPLTFL